MTEKELQERKTFTITVKNVPKFFIKKMFQEMKDAKFEVQSEVIGIEEDKDGVTIDFRDSLISSDAFRLMNDIFCGAMALYTYNPDGKLTPNV